MPQTTVDIKAVVKGLRDIERLDKEMKSRQVQGAKVTQAMPRASKSTQAFGRSARTAAGGVATLGAAIKTALGPLTAVVGTFASLSAGISVIARQDFAEAKVRSLGVASEDLVARLKDVSQELNYGRSVVELTSAAYDVASAGFRDTADAAEILKSRKPWCYRWLCPTWCGC